MSVTDDPGRLSVKDEPYIWRPGAMGSGFSVRAVNKFHRHGRWIKIRLKEVATRQARPTTITLKALD